MFRFIFDRIAPPPAFLIIVLATLAVALVLLTGCETVRTNVGPQVAKAVTRYCQEPLSERQTIRAEVNGLIAPNQIRVTCAGDPPSP